MLTVIVRKTLAFEYQSRSTMKPSIYNIQLTTPGFLYIMPKPSGEWLNEDIHHYSEIGINRIVSLLTSNEEKELDLLKEEKTCHLYGIAYDSFPIEDRGLPEKEKFKLLVISVMQSLQQGQNVTTHCRAGIGRAGLLSCFILQELDFSPREAVETVSTSRGVAVPDTEEQLDFIHDYKTD